MMLAELQEIEARVEARSTSSKAAEEVDLLRRTAHALLSRQFINNRDQRSSRLYEAARRHVDYFTKLFDALGYDFIHESADQWVGIVPADDAPWTANKLSMDETMILLLLGLLWQDGINQGACGDGGTVETTSSEVFSKHADILGRERIPRPRFMEIIKELSRRGLVELGEEDPDTQDVVLNIRSCIRHVAGEGALANLQVFADKSERELDALDRARHAEVGADGTNTADGEDDDDDADQEPQLTAGED